LSIGQPLDFSKVNNILSGMVNSQENNLFKEKRDPNTSEYLHDEDKERN
jgi:hypothetical protein